MNRMILTSAVALTSWALVASAASPVCGRSEELGRKANGRQIWCYTMNGNQEDCEKSYIVRNGKRHGCVFNPNMATFSERRRRNPTGPGRCILEKRMAKFECGLLDGKRIVKRGHYTPPGPDPDETPAQCLDRKAQASPNVNFKIDCEAEAEANQDDIPVLEGEDTRPVIGDPVAHNPGDTVNVVADSEGTYVKSTETNTWDSGFASAEVFAADDAVQGISFKPSLDESTFWVGLQGHAERGIDGHHADFVFAFSPEGWLEIWEDGSFTHKVTQWVSGVGDVGRWNEDSLMEIVVNGEGKVEYKMDGSTVYTSDSPVVYPMVTTALFKTPGSGINDLTFASDADRRRLDGDDADLEEDYDDEEDAAVEEEEDEEEDYDDEEDFEEDVEEEQGGSTRRLRGGKQ